MEIKKLINRTKTICFFLINLDRLNLLIYQTYLKVLELRFCEMR